MSSRSSGAHRGETREVGMQIQRSDFAVCDRVFAVWDPHLRQQNRQFIDAFDPDWFLYVTLKPCDDLEEEPRQRAAHTIRFVYYHALETFFSLLFATIQAPFCLPAWLGLYETRELTKLLDRAGSGGQVKNVFSMPRPTWKKLSHFINRGSWNDSTCDHFAGAWESFAREFLDKRLRTEFNATKHGFRTSPGGFDLRVGIEETPGVAAPPQAMRSLGGSEFGTSVITPINIENPGGTTGRALNLAYDRESLNWSPEATAAKIGLLVTSMRNVLSTLRIIDGDRPDETEFYRPADPEAFKSPFLGFFGVTHLRMNLGVTLASIQPVSREELETIIAKVSGFESQPEEGESSDGQ